MKKSRRARHDTARTWLYTPIALWLRDCPLGRFFDAIDSDEEDAQEAWLFGIVTRHPFTGNPVAT